MHTVKSISKSNQIKANVDCNYLHTFRLILHLTEFRLVPNQLGKCNCNPDLVWFNEIQNTIPLRVTHSIKQTIIKITISDCHVSAYAEKYSAT